MDEIDAILSNYVSPPVAPRDSIRWIRRAGRAPAPPLLARLATRFRIDATERGVARIRLDGGGETATARARRLAERAREELAEYLEGRRTFFSVPVDLGGVGAFQARVLETAARIPFGNVASYAEVARRIGRPGAARAVGNALAANPVPVIVPCHRVVRGDGSWGPYLFGPRLKTELLRFERSVPALVGCGTARIVCRRGCSHEQGVRDDHRIVFASVTDAVSVGYRPCRVCRPADHESPAVLDTSVARR